MADPTEPTTVTEEEAMVALQALGIEPEGVFTTAIDFNERSITVTRLRRQADGTPIVAGHQAATVRTVIGIEP